MATALFLTGFEHQVISANGAGIFSAAATGTAPTIDTTTVKGALASVKLVTGTISFQSSSIFAAIASQTRIADGFWFRYSGNPSAEIQIREFSLGNSIFAQVRLDTNGDLRAHFTGGTSNVTGAVIACSPDTWYWVALTVDNSTTSCVAKLRVTPDGGSTTVNGSNATTTSTGTGALATAGRFGVIAGVSLTTSRDLYFDDFITGSCTGVDDFFEPHSIARLMPGSDGTHSFTNNDFSTGDAGTQRANTYTDFWQMLDTIPWATAHDTTDNVTQRVVRTTGYVEVKPEAAPNRVATAIRALLSYSSTTATGTDTAGCIIRNSTPTADVIWGDLPTAQGGNNGALSDYSEATNFFKGAMVTKPAADWTQTEMNALRWRFGGAGDITPVPTWQDLMLEVAYPTNAVVTAVIADATGDLAAPAVSAGSTVTAVIADATGDVAPPVVTAATGATVTAVVADATGDLAAPALSAGANVTAPVADATGDLAAPAVSAGATVVAVAADASGDLSAPTLSGGATVTAVPADATGDVAANLPISVEVVVVAADATGDVAAPVVTAITNATVTAIAADATADLRAPSLSAGATVTAVPADATGDTPAPALTVIVTAVAADATGDLAAPSLSATATVTAVAADGTGDAANPTLTADSTLTAAAADATGDAQAPALTASSTVTATPADATGDTPAPTVSGESNATVLAVTADASGDAASPTVTATVNLTAVAADATGDAAPPFVAGSGSAVVQAVAADATADVATTNLPISVEVVAASAAATGDLPAPSLTVGGTVAAVAADATGDLAPPAVAAGGGATVGAVPAAAAADSPFPALSAVAAVAATAAASFADLIAPTLSAGANLLPPAADATGSAGTPHIISGLVPKRAVRPPEHIGATTEGNTTRATWRRPAIQATLGPPTA